MFRTYIFQFQFYTNIFGRNFVIVVPGVLKRIPNGILGLLCKDHYPECIEIDGRLQPASAWEHYIQAIDRPDREGRCFASKAERVLQELWVSLVCAIIVNTSH